MTSVPISWESDPSAPPARRRIAGWLEDGTPRFAPSGVLLVDGDHVCCHLCGEWFLSVGGHLRSHGWTKDEYLSAFGLERGNPLCGPATSARRSAALHRRAQTETAIREAQVRARERARSGALTAKAAIAAAGRPHSAERRAKTLAALARVDRRANAEATRRRSRATLTARAFDVAKARGFDDPSDLVRARLAEGDSLASISRSLGFHKDWLSRHLEVIDADLAQLSSVLRGNLADVRWTAVAARFGFSDGRAYLDARHRRDGATVSAIAHEAGVSWPCVREALTRYGIGMSPHASSRRAAERRAEDVANSLGFASLADFVSERLAQGVTWRAMAEESGMPHTTLRRYSGRLSSGA